MGHKFQRRQYSHRCSSILRCLLAVWLGLRFVPATEAMAVGELPVAVVRIECNSNASGDELRIFFSRFYVPDLEAIAGASPRLYMDIRPVEKWSESANLPVKGKMVRTLRTFYNRSVKTLRIVLDLDPDLDFEVHPTYYQAENLYVLEIRKSSFPLAPEDDGVYHDVEGIIGP